MVNYVRKFLNILKSNTLEQSWLLKYLLIKTELRYQVLG